jgi:hypothetical protein
LDVTNKCLWRRQLRPGQVWLESGGTKFVEMKENTPLNNRAPFLNRIPVTMSL